MNIAIFIDGILRGGFGQPLANGTALFKTLADGHRLLLIGRDEEADKRWLSEEGLTGYAVISPIHPLDVEEQAIARTLTGLRSRGPVDMVLTADPDHARQVYALGCEVFLFVSRTSSHPSWRPDARKQGPTPWEAFLSEVRNQRRAAAAIPPVPDE